ncbi:MAG: transcription-repair coupling factor [Candidatus Aminicenantes bacterium]|nr:transcription-repair coupling factor [Candidatus Aminicenantes bacterium]
MGLDFLKDVPEFKGLVRALAEWGRGPNSLEFDSRPPFFLSGLIEASKPYFFTMLARAASARVVLVLPSDRPLADFEERARFFFAALGSTQNVRALPPLAENPYQGAPPPLEAKSSRMRFFYETRYRPPVLVVTNLFGLLRPFPSAERLPGLFLRVEKDAPLERDGLIARLAGYGYVREDLISFRGEYAYRGGIVDVFSPWQTHPVRVEFSGDRVVSVREFDPATQRSTRQADSALIPSLVENEKSDGGHEPHSREWGHVPAIRLPDFLKEAVFVIDSPEEVEAEWDEATADLKAQEAALRRSGADVPSLDDVYPPALWDEVRRRAIPCGALAADEGRRAFHFPFQSVPRFENKVHFFAQYMKRLQEERERATVFLGAPAIRTKLRALLEARGVAAAEAPTPLADPKEGEILLCLGDLGQGFSYPRERVSFFAEEDILTEEKVIVHRPAVRPTITQFQDLKAGDFIVHADYGVGVFSGLHKMDVDGQAGEFMELRYRDDDKLFVPVEDLALVQKFTPVGSGVPPLDKLGTGNWQKTSERTKRAVEKLAEELLELYARRKAVKGFAFSPEGQWQDEFEKTFEYEETEDQLRSTREIKADMEADAPMDRLLCGDVGYGKTEVALRAAFKAVMDGKQAAVLCPTTVLASQHFKTFSSRLVLFPVRVAALTRLQPAAERAQTVEDLKSGQVDIVVGTHRLLSRDVVFRDLGLLVVDEEQRFGVGHKEKIKHLKSTIDVLTLTATPIPRTLNLSLTGLRDISLIETPPKDRLAVHTVVTSFSPRLVRTAVKQELARGGQVYYILNKIEEMDHLAAQVREWVPAARVITLHGQMRPAELERRMMDFIDRKGDVLVSTTIIENGIDIPLVNTLIVHRADHFGLAQLYQLRGRVGRSSRQAYAYFLVPPLAELTPLARRRLEALKEFSELGSGFRLAMKDLEIRGAGHLLGERQHGMMEAVGYDYFIHLLDQAIRRLKGEGGEEVRSEINLKVDVRIPEAYLPQMNVRLNLYKRISSAESLEGVLRLGEEIRDRFGPPPPSVLNLLEYGRIKHLAGRLAIKAVDRLDGRLVFKFLPATGVEIGRVSKVLNRYRGTMTPQGVMSLPLPSGPGPDVLRETVGILKELLGIG